MTSEVDTDNYNCLSDQLNAFFQDEILDNGNIVECDKCIKNILVLKILNF